MLEMSLLNMGGSENVHLSGSDSNVLSPAHLDSRPGLHINISSGLTTGEMQTFIKSS